MVNPERHRLKRSKKKKGVVESNDRFVRLTYELINSVAWKCLTPASVKVYIELRKHFNGSNNGNLFLSLLDGAKSLNMSTSTVKRSLDQLVEHGIVRCAERGYFTGRIASRYILTNERYQGLPPTKDYLKFKPKISKRRIPKIGIEVTLRELKGDQ